MQKKSTKIILNILKLIMLGLTLLGFVKSILISLDIDESYAVAIGYRLTQGDRLLKDMWEPHQFSAFLAALFTAPYVKIHGNTDYLVIYLRLAGVVIHTGLGLALYKQLRRTCGDFLAFGIMILHLNFLPKWIQMPEFELMHYWCLLSIFLFIYTYITGQRKLRFLILGGGILTGGIMCYPTLILLYPFYVFGIWAMERQYFGERGRKAWIGSLFFTLGTLLTGMVLIGYLFSYMSLEQIKHYTSYIFLDTSHGIYTMGEKWAMYMEQLQEQGVLYLGHLLQAAGMIVVLFTVYKIVLRVNKKIKKQKTERTITAQCGLPILILILLLAGLFMQVRAVWGNLFEDKNQFFYQARYIAVLLPGVVLGIRYRNRMAAWLYLCVIPGILSVLAVLFVTNMDTNVTYSKVFIGVLGSFLILNEYGKNVVDRSFWKKSLMAAQYATGGMVLATLLVCRLLLIRVTGCLPVTVLAPLEKMWAGPEAGIYVLADTAQIWNDNYRELGNYVDREDKLLYIGAENLVYVKTEACPATPSTQGTTVFNEMYLYYYEEHPDRLPDIVVFDKTFGENPAYALSYGFSLENHVFFDWVEEHYGNGKVIETDHMIILRK